LSSLIASLGHELILHAMIDLLNLKSSNLYLRVPNSKKFHFLLIFCHQIVLCVLRKGELPILDKISDKLWKLNCRKVYCTKWSPTSLYCTVFT